MIDDKTQEVVDLWVDDHIFEAWRDSGRSPEELYDVVLEAARSTPPPGLSAENLACGMMIGDLVRNADREDVIQYLAARLGYNG